MQEVKTVIAMEKFDPKKASFTTEGDYTKVSISADVISGLREYVATISTMYRDNNPFHNFEHASHVAMSVQESPAFSIASCTSSSHKHHCFLFRSVKKLLKRIVTPELSAPDTKKSKKNSNRNLAYRLHDYTLGLASDPLALLAITFSALIHDV